MELTTNNQNKELISDLVITSPLTHDESYTFCVKGDALRLANMFKESVPKYLRSIMINHDNDDAYYGLALSYKGLQNYVKAIEILKRLENYRPDDFSVYYELGICSLMNGEPVNAIKYLIKSIKLNPDNFNAQVQLALAHELVGEQDMALMIYQRIIEFAPDFLKAYKHKAALLMSLEEYKDASSVFNEILKVQPAYTKAILGIGICFDKLKRSVDAMRYYIKFVNNRPDSAHTPFVKNRLTALKRERPQDKKLSLVTNPI